MRSARAGSHLGMRDAQASIQAGPRRAACAGQEITGPQPVQHRVAEMSVGPVHDGRRPAVAAPVTGVEVTMHDGVRQAAVIQQSEPAQQPARRSCLPGAKLAAGLAVEQGADLPGDDRCAPVGQSGREASRPVGQDGLGGGQAPDGAGDDRW